MTELEKLADLILPDVDRTPAEYEAMYPPRDLPEGARVTRIAPSPTGYLHIGTLFVAMVNRLVASSTGGVFFSRIEDTDKKREVEGGVADIIGGLRGFGIEIDEGFVSAAEEVGAYGPYQQSKRAAIYRCYVKELVRQGLAYPCFCTAEELARTAGEREDPYRLPWGIRPLPRSLFGRNRGKVGGRAPLCRAPPFAGEGREQGCLRRRH